MVLHGRGAVRTGRPACLEARLFENALDDMILSRLTGREGIASIYRYVNVGSAKIRGGLISIDSPSAEGRRCTGRMQYLFTRDFSADPA